ncbi:MAG: pilus assembly protein PilZ [Sulfitobacter sp.]
MASTDTENLPTPESVAKIATQQASLNRVAVIGIFGSETNLNALVRENNGDIARVSVGDKFNGGVIKAIDADSLILLRSGKTKVMKLPRA